MTRGEELIARCTRHFAPPPRMTLSQWARAHLRLSGEYSLEVGEFQPRTYQVEMLDAFTMPGVERIVCMMAAQLGKTLMQTAALGYVIDKDPGPCLMVLPNEDDAKTFSRERLATALRDIPCLRGKVADVKSRDPQNTTKHKRFPGGFIALVGAIAPAGLARRPIRFLFLDEVDRYPISAGGEGDPIELARKRTATYRHCSRTFLTSTPTIAGRSRIAREYEKSDQREFYVPCPKCSEAQTLSWGQVKWDNALATIEEKAGTAHYECRHCRANWTDRERWLACDKGVWKARKPTNGVVGFKLSELYRPYKPIAEFVADFLAKKANPQELKVWVNTVLCELWEEQGETPEPDVLMGRREAYSFGADAIIPTRGLFLTAGVDVQDERLVYEVVAWGRGKESWSVDAGAVQAFDTAGKPLRTNGPEVWLELEKVLRRDWRHESGNTMPVMAMAVDTGERPQPVYTMARRHPQPLHGPTGSRCHAPRTVIAVKGSSRETGEIIIRASTDEAARQRGGVKVFLVGVGAVKQALYDDLQLPHAGAKPIPGYCHFPMYERSFFDELCAEKRVVHPNGRVEWVKHGANHFLDARVYARAAAEIVGISRFTERQWQRLEAQFPQHGEPRTDTSAQSATAGVAIPPRRRVIGTFAL